MSDEDNPYTFLKNNPIYENPWFAVEQHDVLQPSGKQGIYGKILFKNEAVGIVAVEFNESTQEYDTWLVGQYRYPIEKYSWEIPEGGCPVGTDLLESAKRELREETGLSAKKWQKLTTVHTSNASTNEVGTLYLAQDLTQGETDFDETEVIEIKRLPLSEALNMVETNEITDALSMIALVQAYKTLLAPSS